MLGCSVGCVVASLVVLLLTAVTPTAQTLPGDEVVNGSFDGSTVVPWTTSFDASTLAFDSTDADGCGGSGSGLVTHNEGQSATVWFSQCLTGITDAQVYDFGARVLFPAADPDGNAYVLVYWYPTADCSAPYSGAASSPWLLGSGVAGSWSDTVALTVAPDSQTQSALIRLALRRGSPSSGTPVLAHFDDVFFVPAGVLWADGFERGALCRWSSSKP